MELGWKEVLDDMSSEKPHALFKVKAIRQPRPLTEKAWEDMEDEVLEFMQEQREERLIRKHKELREARYRVLKTFWEKFGNQLSYLLPKSRDAVSLPVVKDLIESPADVKIIMKSFDNDEVKNTIMEQLAELQRTQQDMLRKWVQKESKLRLPPESKVALRDLAVVSCINEDSLRVFFQSDEDFVAGPSRNWDRHCAKGPRDEVKLEDSGITPYEDFMDELTDGYRWDTRYLKADWGLIKWVIQQAGEDPAKVTVETMNKKDIRFFCTESCGSDNLRVIMDWKAAVSFHWLENISKKSFFWY